MASMLELAKQGKLGPFQNPQAAVDNFYKLNPLASKLPEGIPSSPTDTGAIGWKDVLRGPATAADFSGRNIGVGQDIQNGQLVNNRSGDPANPALVRASEMQPVVGNDNLNKGSDDDRNAAWAKTLPSHLKPKIEKDAEGNEIVTIQGSLLNKIMKDMYSAGEENYQLQNMPDPEEPKVQGIPNPGPQQYQPQPNPYAQNPVVMQDQTTPQAEVLMRELMKSYPGRTPDEIARILRGGK